MCLKYITGIILQQTIQYRLMTMGNQVGLMKMKKRNRKSGAVVEELSHHGDTVSNALMITSPEPNISEGL